MNPVSLLGNTLDWGYESLSHNPRRIRPCSKHRRKIISNRLWIIWSSCYRFLNYINDASALFSYFITFSEPKHLDEKLTLLVTEYLYTVSLFLSLAVLPSLPLSSTLLYLFLTLSAPLRIDPYTSSHTTECNPRNPSVPTQRQQPLRLSSTVTTLSPATLLIRVWYILIRNAAVRDYGAITSLWVPNQALFNFGKCSSCGNVYMEYT